jgi:hypothetical protein
MGESDGLHLSPKDAEIDPHRGKRDVLLEGTPSLDTPQAVTRVVALQGRQDSPHLDCHGIMLPFLSSQSTIISRSSQCETANFRCHQTPQDLSHVTKEALWEVRRRWKKRHQGPRVRRTAKSRSNPRPQTQVTNSERSRGQRYQHSAQA